MSELAQTIRFSIVVPAYNEQEVLLEFHRRLCGVLAQLEGGSEIVYVNDGSRDNTLAVLHELRRNDARVAVVDLSRNFGKEIALTAGLDYARGVLAREPWNCEVDPLTGVIIHQVEEHAS